MPVTPAAVPRSVVDAVAELVASIATERGSPCVGAHHVLDCKPGQRAVLLVELREPVVLTGGDGQPVDRLYAKVFDDATRAERVERTLEVLWHRVRAGNPTFGLPQPLASRRNPSLLLIAPVRGRPLAELHADRAPWAAVGRWLARLHTADVALPVRYEMSGELRTLQYWGADMAAAGVPTALLDRYRSLIDRTESMAARAAPATVGPIHRDLHQEHVYVDGTDSIGVIDLDEARLGDAHVDLGHLCAHLALAAVPSAAVAAVLEAWTVAAGRGVELEPLALATAMAGLKVARQRTCGFGPSPRPIGDDRWPIVARALDLAHDALQGDMPT